MNSMHRTPLAGESVADFYACTTEYWNVEAGKTVGQAAADRGDAMSSKGLKREGFSLARERYDELKPVLRGSKSWKTCSRIKRRRRQRRSLRRSQRRIGSDDDRCIFAVRCTLQNCTYFLVAVSCLRVNAM